MARQWTAQHEDKTAAVMAFNTYEELREWLHQSKYHAINTDRSAKRVVYRTNAEAANKTAAFAIYATGNAAPNRWAASVRNREDAWQRAFEQVLHVERQGRAVHRIELEQYQ